MESENKQLPNARDRLFQEYEAGNQKYYEEVREYYSSGSIIFNVVGSPVAVPGKYPQYFLRAAAGQVANLFSYKIGDPMGVANSYTTGGAAQRTATIADTNLLEAYKTNDEDFAAMGIGIQVKGLRLEFTTGDDYPSGIDASVTDVITKGTGYLEDPGSHVMPPEVDSPLMLSDVLGRAIFKRLRLREVWNNRAEDDIALARGLGPVGSESYLKTQGEPTTYNAKQLNPGLLWRRVNANRDTKFNVEASLQEAILSIVSWPQDLVAAGDVMGTLTRINVDFQVILVGKSFYFPSENAG